MQGMSWKKLAGLLVAAAGIAWYSYIKMKETDVRSPHAKGKIPPSPRSPPKSPRSARKAFLNGQPTGSPSLRTSERA
jgi:hypothetical protein